MSASEIRSRIAPYTTRRPAIHPAVGLTARLAMLEAECRDFRRELNEAIETPFGLARLLSDAEETHRYDADEDVWGGHDGEPS